MRICKSFEENVIFMLTKCRLSYLGTITNQGFLPHNNQFLKVVGFPHLKIN